MNNTSAFFVPCHVQDNVFFNVSAFLRFQFTQTYYGKIAISPHAVDIFLILSGLLAAKKMFNLFKK